VGDISSTFNGTLTYTGISASSIDVSNFTGSLTINNSLELFTESSAADELVDLGAIAYGYGGELTGDLSDRLTTTAFGGETTSTGGSAADANSSAVALGVNASVDGALNYEVNTTTGNEVVVTATGGDSNADNDANSSASSTLVGGSVSGAVSAGNSAITSTGGTSVAVLNAGSSASSTFVNGSIGASVTGEIIVSATAGDATSTNADGSFASSVLANSDASAIGVVGVVAGNVDATLEASAAGAIATADRGRASADATAQGFSDISGDVNGSVSTSASAGTASGGFGGEITAEASSTAIRGTVGGTLTGNLTASALGGVASSPAGSVIADATAEGINGALTGDWQDGALIELDATGGSALSTAGSSARAAAEVVAVRGTVAGDVAGQLDGAALGGNADSTSITSGVQAIAGASAFGVTDIVSGSILESANLVLSATGGTAAAIGNDADATASATGVNRVEGDVAGTVDVSALGGSASFDNVDGLQFSGTLAEASVLGVENGIGGDFVETGAIQVSATGGTALGMDVRADAEARATGVDGTLSGLVAGTVDVSATGGVATVDNTLGSVIADASSSAQAIGVENTFSNELSGSVQVLAAGGTSTATGNAGAYADAMAIALNDSISADIAGDVTVVATAGTVSAESDTASATASAVGANALNESLSGSISSTATGGTNATGIGVTSVNASAYASGVDSIVRGELTETASIDVTATGGTTASAVDGAVDVSTEAYGVKGPVRGGPMAGTITVAANGGSATSTTGDVDASALAVGVFDGADSLTGAITADAQGGSITAAANGDGSATATGLRGNLSGDFSGSITATATGGSVTATMDANTSATAVGLDGDLSDNYSGTIFVSAENGVASGASTSSTASATGIRTSFASLNTLDGSIEVQATNSTADLTSAVGLDATGAGSVSFTQLGADILVSAASSAGAASAESISYTAGTSVDIAEFSGSITVETDSVADAQAYALNGSTAGALNLGTLTGDLEAIASSSSGSATAAGIIGPAGQILEISDYAANTTVSAFASTDASAIGIDASGASQLLLTGTGGSITVTATGVSTELYSILGSAGNDQIDLAMIALDALVDTGDGADTIGFTNSTVMTDILTGIGDDVLNLTNTNVTGMLVMDLGADALTITGGSVTGDIDTGDGIGTLSFSQTNLMGAITTGADMDSLSFTDTTQNGAIDTGAGDDSLTASGGSLTGGVQMGEGVGTVNLSNVVVTGDLSTGSSADTVVATGGSISGDVTLGDGANSLTFEQLDYSGTLLTGADADTLSFSGVSMTGSTVNSGAGDDTLSFLTGDLDAAVDLGAGSDTVTLTDATLSGTLLGGSEGDSLTFNNVMLTGTLDSGDGDDVLFFTGGSTSSDLLTGAGMDQITISQAMLNGGVLAGGDDDILSLQAADIFADIDMGAGAANSITISGETVLAGNILSTGGTTSLDILGGAILELIQPVTVSNLSAAMNFQDGSTFQVDLYGDATSAANPILTVTDAAADVSTAGTVSIIANPATGESIEDFLDGESYPVIEVTGAGATISGTFVRDGRSYFNFLVDQVTDPTQVVLRPSSLIGLEGDNTVFNPHMQQQLAQTYFELMDELATHAGKVRREWHLDSSYWDKLEAGDWIAYARQINFLGEANSDGAIAGYDFQTYGLVLGAEGLVGDNLLLGGWASVSYTNMDGTGRSGGGNSTLYTANLYGSWIQDLGYVDFGLGLGFANNSTDRYSPEQVYYGGDFDSTLFGTWLEAGIYLLDEAQAPEIEAYARTAYISGHHDGMTDSAASGGVPLTLYDNNTDNWLMEVGIRNRWTYDYDDSEFVWGGKLAWRGELLDDQVTMNGQFFGFDAQYRSPKRGMHALVLGLLVDYRPTESLELGVGYEPVIGMEGYYHAIGLNLNYRF